MFDSFLQRYWQFPRSGRSGFLPEGLGLRLRGQMGHSMRLGVAAVVAAGCLDLGATSTLSSEKIQAVLSDALEWTTVSAGVRPASGDGVDGARPGGVAFFILQRRLIEITPGADALVDVARRAEGVAAVVSTGTISLRLPPGNYAMVWAPGAEVGPDDTVLLRRGESVTMLGVLGKAGPDALMNSGSQSEQERAEASRLRREAIGRSAGTRLPVVVEGNRLNVGDGQGPVYVAFNRYVRPPFVDFGVWDGGSPETGKLLIRLVDGEGRPVTRGALRVRGHNGDLLDPVPLGRYAGPGQTTAAATEPGTFLFREIYAQPYQAVLLDTPPPPPAPLAAGASAASVQVRPSDRPEDRTIKNPDFVYDGKPLELTMTVEAMSRAGSGGNQ